jgi:hypothetical protein
MFVQLHCGIQTETNVDKCHKRKIFDEFVLSAFLDTSGQKRRLLGEAIIIIIFFTNYIS